MLLLLLIHGFMPFAAVAQTPWHTCGISGNYKLKSTYVANLELLSAELPGNASSTPTFYAKGSIGAAWDTIYGLALCRGDTTNASACGECVATAFQDAQQLCAFRKNATIYYDTCILSLSSQDFIHKDGIC